MFLHSENANGSNSRMGSQRCFRAGSMHSYDVLLLIALSKPVAEPDVSELSVVFGN
jgi:hypothetical protein